MPEDVLATRKFVKEDNEFYSTVDINVQTNGVKKMISQIASAVQNIAKNWAEEDTNRRQIAARENVVVKTLDNQTKLMMEAMSQSSNKSMYTLENLFSGIDKAIEKGNDKALEVLLNQVQGTLENDPIKQISSGGNLRKALNEACSEGNLESALFHSRF